LQIPRPSPAVDKKDAIVAAVSPRACRNTFLRHSLFCGHLPCHNTVIDRVVWHLLGLQPSFREMCVRLTTVACSCIVMSSASYSIGL